MNTNKIEFIFGATLMTLTLNGCAVGASDYLCSVGSDSGMCASASTIYTATNGELKESETITYYDDGKAKQITISELEKERLEEGNLSGKKKVPLSTKALPMNYSHANAVKTSARVMKVWIAPWISKDDSLNMERVVFTEVDARKWQYGRSEMQKNSYQAPFKSSALGQKDRKKVVRKNK